MTSQGTESALLSHSSRPGILWIVSAPSGAGKTSLSRALLECTDNLRASISYTTRTPRPGEVNGEHYHFIDDKVFHEMAEAGAFLEHAKVFSYQYGTGEDWVKSELIRGADVLLEIDWQGARQARERLPGQFVSIFILPPSFDALRQRLQNRGQDDSAIIQQRMDAARREMIHYDEYDYVIINDDFNKALGELRCIVTAERLRLSRHPAEMRAQTQNLLGF